MDKQPGAPPPNYTPAATQPLPFILDYLFKGYNFYFKLFTQLGEKKVTQTHNFENAKQPKEYTEES